ncbi:hypothetical protein RJZ56_007501 [Blastomyces dermatitidis]
MPRMNFNKQMIKQSFLELSLASLASGRPVPHANVPSRLRVREAPQELSHSKFLASVQESLQDTAFELLDNEAFTHVKAAGDVDGMTHSLIYRALERNTGTVGLASALCESMEAVNPEVAAITQHQDPASAGAAEINKQIALDLTVQIASIGGDLLLAIESSTFAPGDVNDATRTGNNYLLVFLPFQLYLPKRNTEGDEEGCIFTENLLVPDVTEEEIISSKLNVTAVDAVGANDVPDQATASTAATVVETETAATASTAETAPAAATSEAVAAASGSVD